MIAQTKELSLVAAKSDLAVREGNPSHQIADIQNILIHQLRDVLAVGDKDNISVTRELVLETFTMSPPAEAQRAALGELLRTVHPVEDNRKEIFLKSAAQLGEYIPPADMLAIALPHLEDRYAIKNEAVRAIASSQGPEVVEVLAQILRDGIDNTTKNHPVEECVLLAAEGLRRKGEHVAIEILQESLALVQKRASSSAVELSKNEPTGKSHVTESWLRLADVLVGALATYPNEAALATLLADAQWAKTQARNHFNEDFSEHYGEVTQALLRHFSRVDEVFNTLLSDLALTDPYMARITQEANNAFIFENLSAGDMPSYLYRGDDNFPDVHVAQAFFRVIYHRGTAQDTDLLAQTLRSNANKEVRDLMTYALRTHDQLRNDSEIVSSSDIATGTKELSNVALLWNLEAAARFGYTWERQKAIRMLEHSGKMWTVPYLLRIAKGQNSDMRCAAIQAMATLQYPRQQMKDVVVNELLAIDERAHSSIRDISYKPSRDIKEKDWYASFAAIGYALAALAPDRLIGFLRDEERSVDIAFRNGVLGFLKEVAESISKSRKEMTIIPSIPGVPQDMPRLSDSTAEVVDDEGQSVQPHEDLLTRMRRKSNGKS